MKTTPKENKCNLCQLIWKNIISWFRPSYDETTLFLIALTSTLLLLRYQNADSILGFIFAPPENAGEYQLEGDPRNALFVFFLLLIIAIIGFGLSLFHAFSSREKMFLQKPPWQFLQ